MRIAVFLLFYAIGCFIGVILACSIIDKTNPFALVKYLIDSTKEDIE